MASITTRAGKGSPLTNAEVDANFTNLNTELGTMLTAALAASTYQPILVSGTSIKTVNGQSVLGSGNIQIDGGVTSFNTRTGAVSLTSGDVTTALGFTPFSAAGGQISGNTGVGGAASANARLRVLGSGASSEVVRFEGGTLSALLLINQTDDPGVNTNRSGVSFRKNNTEGGAISVDYNGSRGIVYYDAAGATGQHAFYVNGVDRMRLSPSGGLSFSGAGYGTAGQLLKSGGTNGSVAWAALTSGEVTTALGYTPLDRAVGSSDWNTKTNGQAVFISSSNNSHNGVTNISGLYMPHTTGGFGVQVGGRLDNLYFRTEESGTWAAWRTLIHSGNFTSYSPSLTGSGASGTWGISVTGNAGTVTNGVYTTGSYSDPSWITDLSASKLTGGTIPSADRLPTFGYVWPFANLASFPATGVQGRIYIASDTNLTYRWTGSAYVGLASGSAATATTLQTARSINAVSFNGSADITIPRVRAIDDRTAAPADGTTAYATFGFGSWNNNNTSPYADFWLMRSYTDSSGGSDNMVMFRKDAIGMRIWQQTYGSATAFSSYVDVLHSGNFTSYSPGLTGSGASGTWAINVTGSAGSLSSNSTYMVNRGNTTEGSLNSATANGFYAVAYTGSSSSLLTWNAPSSTGPVQMEFFYQGNARFRSQTDSATWTAWKEILTSANYTSYAPSLTGSGASGTWGISITGSAGSAATATNASQLNGLSSTQLFNNMGQVHGAQSDFASISDFGFRYVQGSANGPGIPSATQYYGMTIGLGNDYAYSSYASQLYWPRTPTGGNPYLSVRFREAGSWGSWSKIWAGYADSAGALSTGNSYQMGSLGVGTSASGTTGEIRATNNITAYFSDDRLKTRLGVIENALSKVRSLTGFYYEANETAQALGYEAVREVGLSAQETQAVLPEIVVPAPIDDRYLTIRYEKVVPLLVEAIKELAAELDLVKSALKGAH